MAFNKINIKITEYLKNENFKILKNSLLLFVVAVIAFGLIYNSPNEYNNYEYSLFYEWLAYFIILTAIIYTNLKVLVPNYLLEGKLTKYICFIMVCTIIALLFIILTQNILYYSSAEPASSYLLLNITGNLLSIGLILVSTSIYPLFRGWSIHSKYIYELKASTTEAELQQLKSQINPHFLFNIINNANIKADKDAESAFNIINKLKDLLSYQLEDSINNEVKLEDEISFLSDYLDLEKTRRSKFGYQLSVDGEVTNLMLPPLLFIPFVGNAVKHSLTTKEYSTIDIAFSLEQEDLHFYCKNTKPTIPIKHKSGGLGLENIKRRLSLLYGNAYTLKITDSNESYIVNLYLKI